jgi:hypothetical protein
MRNWGDVPRGEWRGLRTRDEDCHLPVYATRNLLYEPVTIKSRAIENICNCHLLVLYVPN